MVDTLVKLIEKIKELIEYRNKRRADRFSHLIKPMYDSLAEVHTDYIAVFENTKNNLQSNMPLKDIVVSLEDRRLAEEGARSAVLEQAMILASDENLIECHEFFRVVTLYFHLIPFTKNNSMSALLTRAMRAAADEPNQEESRRHLKYVTDRVLELLRSNWQQISQQYAKALAQSVD